MKIFFADAVQLVSFNYHKILPVKNFLDSYYLGIIVKKGEKGFIGLKDTEDSDDEE